MSVYEKLLNKSENLALVGLGYVGMPIAVAFAKKGLNVIGFDLNKAKIELYKSGVDPTLDLGDADAEPLRYHVDGVGEEISAHEYHAFFFLELAKKAIYDLCQPSALVLLLDTAAIGDAFVKLGA